MNVEIKQCARCVLDTDDDTELSFDSQGVCKYCRDYDEQARRFVFTGRDAEARLQQLVDEIKTAGKKRQYDCILGLSGGVDSTYLALQTCRLGLRPLAVHCDNGWNSELAVGNIENIVKKLNLDLHTYVIDWEEFRDVQLAYLKASVIDIEAITDHAILGTLFRLAKEYKIKYLLSGTNIVTEAVLPPRWIFNKHDDVNLRAIHAQYGNVPLVRFPLLDWKLKAYCNRWLRVRSVSLLNYFPYVKKDVKRTIATELGWRDYGVKHGESVFTRFYQSYILPRKFHVDKRKAHLSNLICSGQMSREEALEELKQPIYDPAMLKLDLEFVLKKLGLSADEFEALMRLPVRSHYDFPIEKPLHQRHPMLAPLKLIGRLVGSV
jgi:N-acetyl sugar amidotransferase